MVEAEDGQAYIGASSLQGRQVLSEIQVSKAVISIDIDLE